MTYDEADKIIAELNIVFPSKKLLVEEVKRWEDNLAPYDYLIARNAVRRTEESMTRWPSWAEFLQELKICVSEHNRSLPKYELDEAPPLSVEENIRRAKELRALMGSMFRE